MSLSKAFFFFCIFFIFGVFLGGVLIKKGIPPFFQIILGGAVLILSLALISVFWKYKKIVIFGVCLIFTFLGLIRYFFAEKNIECNKLEKFNDIEEDISLFGRVSFEPEISQKNTKLTLKISEIEFPDGRVQKVNGKILVFCNKYPQYNYGDVLKITGKLKTPPVFEGFNYKDYLKKKGIYSVVYYPAIEILKRRDNKGFSFLFAKILDLKSRLRGVIYQNLAPQKAELLSALLLGDKKSISPALKEKLNNAGIRHISAVSGMHIVILTSILMFLLMGIGFWRSQAFYLSVIFIFLFVVLTGLQPSAIRAGIMGNLVLFGKKIGRKIAVFRVLAFTAFLMLLQNPFLLLYDVGFQLSFLAIIGIACFSSFFNDLFKKIPEKLLFLREIISMTISAQIFTFPILLYNFGNFSLVSPISNILVLPVLPWIMGLGFAFVILGAFFPFLGWIFSLFPSVLLSYLLKIAEIFSSLPFSKISIKNFPWFLLLIYYLIFAFVFYLIKKREKLKFLNQQSTGLLLL